jgi:hypothetical protein
MGSLRRALPILLPTVALLLAATTCLTVSYAGVDEATVRPPNVSQGTGREPAASEGQRVADDVEHVWMLGPKEEEREEAENEHEKGAARERAEEAREETEEEREKQGSASPHGSSGSAVLRAHLEVIHARDAASGASPDPCSHAVALPPLREGTTEPTIELRLTLRSLDGTADATRTLAEVAPREACSSHDGFHVDRRYVPARLTLCPSSCAWARGAAQGLSADILVRGF